MAIAVPEADAIAPWAKREGVGSTSAAEILASADGPRLTTAMHGQMTAAAKEAKLAGFEMVKKLHLDAEPWTVDNGMLTPTFKAKRNDLKKRYQEVIDSMYAEADAPASKL